MDSSSTHTRRVAVHCSQTNGRQSPSLSLPSSTHDNEKAPLPRDRNGHFITLSSVFLQQQVLWATDGSGNQQHPSGPWTVHVGIDGQLLVPQLIVPAPDGMLRHGTLLPDPKTCPGQIGSMHLGCWEIVDRPRTRVHWTCRATGGITATNDWRGRQENAENELCRWLVTRPPYRRPPASDESLQRLLSGSCMLLVSTQPRM